MSRQDLIKTVRARFKKRTAGEYYGAMALVSALEPMLENVPEDILKRIAELPDKGYRLDGKQIPRMMEGEE